MKKILFFICLPLISSQVFAGASNENSQQDNRGDWAIATTSREVNQARVRIHEPTGTFGEAIQPNQPEDVTVTPMCPTSDWGRATSGNPNCH